MISGGWQPDMQDMHESLSMYCPQIVMYCTLLPITDQLSSTLKAYVAALAALPVVKKAQEVVSGGDDAAVKALFLADSKAYLASQPKLPIPGERNILVG